MCGRKYSGLNCLKCTQQAIFVGNFGDETLGASTKAASTIVAKAPLSEKVAKLKSVSDGQMYAVPRPTCRIGQDSSNDIVILDDETTARYHAQITYDEKDSEYLLRDLGTNAGTYLNGLQVHLDQSIFNGDMIKIGKYKFYFVE